MRTERIGGHILYHGRMEAVIPSIRFDHILTDPPYWYIKHRFDKAFDETLFFERAKQLLPDAGFIGLFGRGTSFYRWNTRLAELGFIFKEEVVWDKHYGSNICGNLLRNHETIALHTRKNGKIRRSKIPYLELLLAMGLNESRRTYGALRVRWVLLRNSIVCVPTLKPGLSNNGSARMFGTVLRSGSLMIPRPVSRS
jgi:hypothetical protein